MPKVSVIVPIYNSEKFLDRCINSLRNQTLEDIEIILVNDNSPDNSLEIAQKYATIDSRIVVIDLKKNIVASRNKGIEVAKSNYIGFVDADDWVEPKMYEKLYDASNNESIDVVVGGIKNCYSSGKIERELNIPKEAFISSEYVKKNVTMHGGRLFTNIWKKDLISKDLYFKEHNLYCDSIVFLWYLKAKSFAYVDEDLYNYYINDQSITHKKNSQRVFDRLDSAIDMYNRGKTSGFFKEYQHEINYRFYCLYYRNSLGVIATRFTRIPRLRLHEMVDNLLNFVGDITLNRYYKESCKDLWDIIGWILNKNFVLGILFLEILKDCKLIKDKLSELRYV